jgi:hypothetical protein
MKANEKYLHWLGGYLRETFDTALKQAFKDFQIDDDTRCTRMSLIDGYIRN